jgi:transcriptional regulator with XRE-family HTH domain
MIVVFGKPERISQKRRSTTMEFDYSKLLGRIKEKGFTQESLARHIGITPGVMSVKLNNQSHFKQREIFAICDALDISICEIGEYFFAPKVRKTRTEEVKANA